MKKLQFLLATMIFSVASFLVPLSYVKAGSYGGNGSQMFLIGVDQNSDKVTEIRVSGGDTTDVYSFNSDFTDFDNNELHYETNGTFSISITADWGEPLTGKNVGVHISDDATAYFTAGTTSINGNTFTTSFSFNIAGYKSATSHNRLSIQPYVEDGTTPSTPEHNPDDTNAWFIWNCNGDLCRYKMTNLTLASETPSHELLYTTNYIKASDVKDVNNNTKVLDLNALLELEKATAPNGFAPYYFIYDDCIINGSTPDTSTCAEGIATITKWSEFQSWWNTHITDYDSQRNFAIDPTGASAGANIISTNGDRRFRATIYDDTDYYGISNASSPADLTYYPSYWDPAFFNPAYDVSGTTLENPMIIQSYLLEPQIVLKNDGVSGEISSLEVASANIPTQAITITKQDDGYKIIFNSRYFDNVTFRITSDGKTYYVAIVRTVVGHVLDPIDDHKRVLGLFVPDTTTKSYDVLATYYWADGTEKTFTMEEMQIGDDGGKGLAMRPYQLKSADASQVDVTPTSANPPIGVSYIAVESGSTTSTFKGALSGSGKGTYYKINHGNYELVTK